jgi:hypothetical protein
MTRIKLTPAQRSALECAGLDYFDRDALDRGERALADAWTGRYLEITPETIDAIIDGLTDRANAEDDLAGMPDCGSARSARGACAALTNLSRKVMDLRRRP